MSEAKHSPLLDQFIWRLEYADCSALEVMPNGQAFLVKPNGARHEVKGFITNRIARWYYPDIRSAMDVAEKATSLHHELVAALEHLANCGNAIIGADPNDDAASEAFEMYNEARTAARALLQKAKQGDKQ